MSVEALQVAQWLSPGEAAGGIDGYVHDGGETVESFAGLTVVAPLADGLRVGALLGAGARRVLVGESALRHGDLMGTLVSTFGPDRIGLWLPVRRAPARWSFDRQSNADFSFVAPGCPVPRWMVRRTDRSLTDVDAVWWAQQMVAAGAALVLVAVDEPEDDDLLVCAEMAEVVGERFWLTPGSADLAELRFWVRYGQVRNLVLPRAVNAPEVLAALSQRLAQEAANA